jgi:hypothetical protein
MVFNTTSGLWLHEYLPANAPSRDISMDIQLGAILPTVIDYNKLAMLCDICSHHG